MIEVEDIVKKYDTNYAVAGVSFSVKKGEIVGFLGPNGAGKTTTMRIITGFLPADSGDVSVNNVSVHDDILAVKKSIGYLPESAPLYGDMMVDEYLDYVARARGIPVKECRAKVDSISHRVGLESVRKKNIDELSKGYRQRVGLAQSLIHDPEVLILDEPTSGLDPIQIQEIRSLIREIGKEKTVILSTHIMQEVEAVCDRVLIIARGKIVAEGTPEELKAQGKGKSSLTLSVHGDARSIEEKIHTIPQVKEIIKLEELTDGFRYNLVSNEGISREVFSWVVENGFVLTELTEKKASLEDLFLELTKEEEIRS